MSEEKTKTIRMKVYEEVYYTVEVDIPEDADPAQWVDENGEAYFCDLDNINHYCTSVEEREIWVE